MRDKRESKERRNVGTKIGIIGRHGRSIDIHGGTVWQQKKSKRGRPFPGTLGMISLLALAKPQGGRAAGLCALRASKGCNFCMHAVGSFSRFCVSARLLLADPSKCAFG
jgi:hypothetical protein